MINLCCAQHRVSTWTPSFIRDDGLHRVQVRQVCVIWLHRHMGPLYYAQFTVLCLLRAAKAPSADDLR